MLLSRAALSILNINSPLVFDVAIHQHRLEYIFLEFLGEVTPRVSKNSSRFRIRQI